MDEEALDIISEECGTDIGKLQLSAEADAGASTLTIHVDEDSELPDGTLVLDVTDQQESDQVESTGNTALQEEDNRQ